MWNAMSNCYNKMGKKAEAKRCSERAERFKDKEGIALHKLAKLYVSIGDPERAAACFKLNLKRKEMEESSETSEALLYLAKHCKSQGKYEEAMQYARHLHDYFGTDREEAGALIREINKSRQLEHNQNQQF
jgi:anaphase-promoting complex subunit 8